MTHLIVSSLQMKIYIESKDCRKYETRNIKQLFKNNIVCKHSF